MKKIIKILFSIVLSVILSLALYFAITNKEPNINFLGMRALIISSGSMEPELMIGDVIIIKQDDDYNVGDIITFNDNNSLVTHRIVKKDGSQFVTKGDNNNTQDREIVNYTDIQGKVILNSKILKFIYAHWLVTILAVILLFFIF